jgi:hypothetical protein
MFHIVTSYYRSEHPQRQKEIDDCLLKNVENPYIQSIHLLNDQIYPLEFLSDQRKIVQKVVDDDHKKRLGFDYAIQYINENLMNERYILTNSDIYFDDTLKLIQDYNFTNTVMALSRYDNGHLCNRGDSQDCWIGVAPLQVDLSLCSFKFGIGRCDNRIAWVIHHAGYHLFNPSKTIHIHHLHQSNIRNYIGLPGVGGEIHFVEPCELT